MSTALTCLGLRDRDLLVWNLNGYIDNASWRNQEEIPLFGKALGHIFEPIKKDDKAILDVKQRASEIGQFRPSLSDIAQRSLQEMTEAILDMYEEPSDWVSSHHFHQQLRDLIKDRVEQRTVELIQSSYERCQELFVERERHCKRLENWRVSEQKVKQIFAGGPDLERSSDEEEEMYVVGCYLIDYKDDTLQDHSFPSTIENVFNSKSLALYYLQIWPRRIRYFSKALRADSEVVFLAFKKDWQVLKWASPDLLNCPHFMSKCLSAEGYGSHFICKSLVKDDFLLPIANKCISNPASVLRLCSAEARSKAENILPIIKRSSRAFPCATRVLTDDPDFKLRACELNTAVINFFEQKDRLNPRYLLLAIMTPNHWLVHSVSRDFSEAIISLLQDTKIAKEVCLKFLIKAKNYLQIPERENYKPDVVYKHNLKGFSSYVFNSNPLLWKDLDFWTKVLAIEPSLITDCIRRSPDWRYDPVILEQLKSSHSKVRISLDAFGYIIEKELHLWEFAHMISLLDQI